MKILENVDICIEGQEWVAKHIAETLFELDSVSELELSERLKAAVYTDRFHSQGWYAPPPSGVGVVFAEASDNYERAKFPNLRADAYWPKEQIRFANETVATVYVSPVDKDSGAISDFGISFYIGNDERVQNHLRTCLEATEEIADCAETGMKFKELFAIAEDVIAARGLQNSIMVTVNDPTHGADYGHSFPWTDMAASPNERRVINGTNFDELIALISGKRRYINPVEEFTIPETIVFSIEPRLTSRTDAALPGGYFYHLVAFREGQKTIVANFNGIFDKLGITYMRSKF